jgi:hypothetical protein
MYKEQSDIDGVFRKYTTDQTSDQVQSRAFEWRKGNDTDVTHTAMRLGYHEPLKGRVHIDTLECADGKTLYRPTIDGAPLLYDDEDEYGGWMTYHQLLCFIEGYRRLSDVEHFVERHEQEKEE